VTPPAVPSFDARREGETSRLLPHATPSGSIPVVYIVDDEEVVRDALAWLLRSRRPLPEGLASANAFSALVASQGQPWPRAPGCLLLDVRMPGTSGLVLFERLVQAGLTAVLPVIFLTGHGDVPTAVAAVKRGAFDFVEKPFSNNALVDRIEQALALSATELAARQARDAAALALAELTERERDVMRLVIDGRPNKLIAEALQISVRTVEVHRARVFEKMGVRSAVELANLLRRPASAASPPSAGSSGTLGHG
jgi:two-component system, LuxR family, response regulator DctR